MKKLTLIFLTFLLLLQNSYSKEKILEEKNYPAWLHSWTNPNNNKPVFGENEIIDKVTKNGNVFVILSHDNDYNYIATVDKIGNPIKNEAFSFKDNKQQFLEEFYEKSFNVKYEKLYLFDDNNNEIKDCSETWYLNDSDNRIRKETILSTGTFEYKYNIDGSYEVTCTERPESADFYCYFPSNGRKEKYCIFNYPGSKLYFDKNNEPIKRFTNSENEVWEYFNGSNEYKEFIEKNNIDIPKDEIHLFVDNTETQYLFFTDSAIKYADIFSNGDIWYYDPDGSINYKVEFKGMEKTSKTNDGYIIILYQINKKVSPNSYEYYVNLTSNNTEEYFTWCFNELVDAMVHFRYLETINVVDDKKEIENSELYKNLSLQKTIEKAVLIELLEESKDKRTSWRKNSYKAVKEDSSNYIRYWISNK